jgi:diphthamide synthase (EF-2-diphthine--ammonia ligase)
MTVGFGDIFLQDLRAYRETKLDGAGMKAVFPLWKKDTKELPRIMYEAGFRSIITCVDTQVLDKEYAGQLFSPSLCENFPSGVDPCGENGEFHSFVFEAPNFNHIIKFQAGEKVLRDERFFFCDLLPV